MNETAKNLLIRSLQSTAKHLVSLAVMLYSASEKHKHLSELEKTDKAYDFLIKMFEHGKEYKELFSEFE